MFCLELSQRLPRQWLGKLFHEFVPCDRLSAVVLPDHGDASFHGADQEAQPAANALILSHSRLCPAIERDQVDALVCSIFTRNVAQITVDAL
jgi:hypothetical protein